MSPAPSTFLKQQQFFFYLRKKRNHREVSLTKVTCKIIQSNFFLCRYKHCQSQVGSSEYGLVSLAFAYVPAKGEDPCNYTFNQGKMRNHLFKCILHGRITDFPVTRIGYRKKITYFIFEIYCICRMPHCSNVEFIECDKCKEWYHVDVCVTVPQPVLQQKSLPWLSVSKLFLMTL